MDTQNTRPEPRTAAPSRSLDRLLLDETNHRVANEVASALAALRLVQSARGRHSREHLLDVAIERLEGFGETARLLAAGGSGQVDAATIVDRVCRAALRPAGDAGPRRVVLDLAPSEAGGETARRIAMVAHELVTNARKHAFPDGRGELEVRLCTLADALVLTVSDDGPGLTAATPGGAGSRLGGRIVADIVRASNGMLQCETGPDGTIVHVSLPIA